MQKISSWHHLTSVRVPLIQIAIEQLVHLLPRGRKTEEGNRCHIVWQDDDQEYFLPYTMNNKSSGASTGKELATILGVLDCGYRWLLGQNAPGLLSSIFTRPRPIKAGIEIKSSSGESLNITKGKESCFLTSSP